MKSGLTTAFAALLLAGCATTAPPSDERHPRDPWEPYNRNMFKFNSAVDQAVIRPLAVGYGKVTNKPVRRSVRNFFTNIRAPVVIANLLLQGRPGDAGTQLERFFINSTVGVVGLFDLASDADIESYDEDFGPVWTWSAMCWCGRPG